MKRARRVLIWSDLLGRPQRNEQSSGGAPGLDETCAEGGQARLLHVVPPVLSGVTPGGAAGGYRNEQIRPHSDIAAVFAFSTAVGLAPFIWGETYVTATKARRAPRGNLTPER
jgi:hypothetical protein